jgi:cysteine desulfurase
MNYPIYLDFNATTPVLTEVLEAMIPYMTTHFGNAASASHAFGWKAAEAIDLARAQVAQLLGVSEKEIVFTSGATESINLAIKGGFDANSYKGKHIITAITEHKAVLDTCSFLEKKGAKITYLPVDKNGEISVSNLEKAILSETILISVMAANNETGIINPINKIAKIAQNNKIIFHTDATQAIGKIPTDLSCIDLLSFSGHKIYGPKGVGVLYINKNCKILAQQQGGQHERGLRAGTQNVAGIVGMGKAAEILQIAMAKEAKRMAILRDKLEQNLLQKLPQITINGRNENRLPNTTNICFGEIDGEQLLFKLNEIAVSNGSACNSASTEPSYVLKAMGLSAANAYSSLRFSLGKTTQESEIDFAIQHIVSVVNSIQNERN